MPRFSFFKRQKVSAWELSDVRALRSSEHRLSEKRSFSTASDLKISGEASGDERRAALAVRDVKRMVAEGRERVPVVQVGVKHEIVFAAGEVRADLCVVQAGNGGERLDGRRKARFGFSPSRYSS